MPWTTIEEPVRFMIELPLSRKELLHLEKQEKEIRIMVEELKALQSENEKVVIRYKQRLEWKGVARKVLSAVQNKAT
jgi:hypothetical protein